jgi:hypothetical protein
MALCARLTGNRRVHIVKQYSSPVRAMGVMARGTVRLCHRVIHVLFLKVGPICLVTAYTESDQIIFQKMIRFGRGMGIVAAHAPLFHRIMFKFHFCNRIANILMAIKTEFIPSLQKNELIV